MPCLANPPALAEMLPLSARCSRNPTWHLQGLRRCKWHEGGMGHADGAFWSCAKVNYKSFIWELHFFYRSPPFLCYSVMKSGSSLKFLCFITFHFMSKSHEENIFDQISLTFLSFLVSSMGCCLLNIDYQIKFCTETEYIKFMFI